MNSIKFGIITCAIALTLLACSQGKTGNSITGNDNSANTAKSAPPADNVDTGRKLYKQTCAACHKESGKGGKMVFEDKTINPDDLTGDKLKHVSDEKLFEYITVGVEDEGMPSFKGRLKEPEIREIVRFIRAELQKQGAD
jgi:mono/diheme cytochrome c family protein